MRMLRTLRGGALIAVVWGAVFAGAGALFGLGLALGIAVGILPPSPNGRSGVGFYGLLVLSRAVRWAAVGVFSGIMFAATVAVAEHRQTLASLSASRFARWGLLASALTGVGVAAPALATLLGHAGTHTVLMSVLAAEFASMPLIGSMLGRTTAVSILRAARGDVRVHTPPSARAIANRPF